MKKEQVKQVIDELHKSVIKESSVPSINTEIRTVVKTAFEKFGASILWSFCDKRAGGKLRFKFTAGIGIKQEQRVQIFNYVKSKLDNNKNIIDFKFIGLDLIIIAKA